MTADTASKGLGYTFLYPTEDLIHYQADTSYNSLMELTNTADALYQGWEAEAMREAGDVA